MIGAPLAVIPVPVPQMWGRFSVQYAVQVYDEHFQALYDAGALQTADKTNGLDDRSAVLTDASLYSEATGLSLQADSGQALFG